MILSEVERKERWSHGRKIYTLDNKEQEKEM
jgi:hypothetical protein